MLDELHDDLVFNLGCILGSEQLEEDNPVVATLEGMFLSALRYCHEHEDQLTEDDWVRIGGWLNECEEYFKNFDSILRGIVFSNESDRSGRHVQDMSAFVEKARAVRSSQFETKDAEQDADLNT